MEVITTHLNADFDSLAAMIAASKLYPEALLAFSGSQEKNLREFFVQSSQYKYEFKRPKQIPLDKVKRLIIVDTRQANRIGNFAECLNNKDIELHIFDHHPDTPGDLQGDYEVIRQVGSTSTIFIQIFREKGIRLSQDEATLFAMGIYEDTGSLTFGTTTPADMEAAAWLLEQGADLHQVAQFISHELTAEQVTLLHELIKSAINYTVQGIDIIVAKLSLPDYVDEFALLVRRFMVMENLNTLFALVGMGDRIYLIARSRIPEVNVGEIARGFGGGGHASAASATVKNLMLLEAEEKLIQLLHKNVRPQSLAGELMSSPAITVALDVSIKKANQILTRYNINVLPVLGDNQEILGMISRLVVEKSIFHGLGDLPVNEYMTTEVATLPLSATLADIQELIIENRQRLIPVVDEKEIKGVITRTDLLNLLVNDPSHLPKNLLSTEKHPSSERHRNLNNLMVECLDKDMIILLRTIGEVAEEHGNTAYAVGGFVRDLMIRVKNFDLDVVVEGNGIEFAKHLAKKLNGVVRVHEKFSTAVVKLADDFKIDVAKARLEYYEYPAALPTVELSSIKLDLYRRDFTINAMAIHLNPERFGTLVDFFNCQNDLKDERIRILHNLSFVEDPTRVFRAIRFEQRMGFLIGKHTEKLMKNAVKMNFFDRFSGHRFFGELKMILSEEDPIPALRRMKEFDLLKFIRPSLRYDKRFEKQLVEAQKAIAWNKFLYLDAPFKQWMVYLFIIMANASLKEMASFCERFEVPVKYKNILMRQKKSADKTLLALNRKGPDVRASEIYWLLQGIEQESLLYMIAMARKMHIKKAISHYVTHLRNVTSHLSGDDLAEMGYKAGPIFRTILNHLLEARLDGLVESRPDEIAFVQKKYPLEKQKKPERRKQRA